jgi:SAM-dependent methyltransferase
MPTLTRIHEIIKETDHNYSPYYGILPSLIREKGYVRGIEVGVYCGGHADSILKNSGTELLIGIDPYMLYEPGMPEFTKQEDYDILHDLTIERLSVYENRYKHLRETSDEAYVKLKGGLEQYDFVFIDGKHTYEQCKKDIENYGRLVKKGGVIVCHDYNHPTFPELTTAINEFVSQHNVVLMKGPLHICWMEKTWDRNSIEENVVFNEADYLLRYPDVKKAVLKGWFKNGYAHYVKYGRKEGRVFELKEKLDELVDNVNPSWSDHLVLKGYVEKPDSTELLSINMIDVPEQFRQIQSVEYPEGNKLPFEQYFYKYFQDERPQTLRTYLPIFWTSYYVNNQYGGDKQALSMLREYINTLDKSVKYFTLVQYDDGILNDISGLDVLVYASGCIKAGYYPTPLLCQPLNSSPFQFVNKEILLSFIGAKTHPIRTRLVDELRESGWAASLDIVPYDEYLNILQRSTFALCPRGYGVTSFRLYESMAYGCIPVYISDKFIEPFNLPFDDYGIKITPDRIKYIPEILRLVDVEKMQKMVEIRFKEYFVYSSCAQQIINTLL